MNSVVNNDHVYYPKEILEQIALMERENQASSTGTGPVSRRNFMKVSAGVGGGLVLAFGFGMDQADAQQAPPPGAGGGAGGPPRAGGYGLACVTPGATRAMPWLSPWAYGYSTVCGQSDSGQNWRMAFWSPLPLASPHWAISTVLPAGAIAPVPIVSGQSASGQNC